MPLHRIALLDIIKRTDSGKGIIFDMALELGGASSFSVGLFELIVSNVSGTLPSFTFGVLADLYD